ADGHGGAQTVADVAEEQREVARSTAGNDADVSSDRCIRASQGSAVGRDRLQQPRMRREDAVDDLIHEIIRVVDDLSHACTTFSSIQPTESAFLTKTSTVR